ncbi:hypothetical protein AUP07_0715 [methanogenic archaeon mixed culture ISO4-G1]|nr:hypothetical protein AUP07_0715 [methanogenic archaeon mixed culture ISO4-G1]
MSSIRIMHVSESCSFDQSLERTIMVESSSKEYDAPCNLSKYIVPFAFIKMDAFIGVGENDQGQRCFVISDRFIHKPDLIWDLITEAMTTKRVPLSVHYWLYESGYYQCHIDEYLRVCGIYSCSTKYRNRDIMASVRRLMDLDLITESDIESLTFTWSLYPIQDYWGFYRPDLSLIVINPILSTSELSLRCFDEIVYHEILHHIQHSSSTSSLEHDQ